MVGFLNPVLGVLRTLTLGAILCLFCPFTKAAELRVTALDLLTMEPVGSASIVVRQRHFEFHKDGEIELLPIEQATDLAWTTLQDDGTAEISIKVQHGALLAVEISAAGFLPQIDSMMHFSDGETAECWFLLIREALTPQQAEQLADAQELLRANQPEQEMVVAPERELRAFAAVNVPDRVMVTNLNGFTGMMNLDEYIAGVVTAEMNDAFPREALRTQAVAARSYALARLRNTGYANRGQAYSPTYGTLSRAAALFTTKQVILHNGTIAQAYFSARCNGDFTLNSEDGPTLTACRRGGLGAGVVPFCRSRPCSGHINCSQTSEQCCAIDVNGKTHYIYGHGIGMCQRGAQGFANMGWVYPRILTNYYTGIVLHTGTNALHLSIVAQPGATGTTPGFQVEVRSGQPETFFDLQSTTTLTNPTWTTVSGEARLNTGPGRVVQVQPRAMTTQQRYFRAVLRD